MERAGYGKQLKMTVVKRTGTGAPAISKAAKAHGASTGSLQRRISE